MKLMKKQKGVALIFALAVLEAVLISGITYVNITTQSVRLTKHRQTDIVLLNLCEAGIQRKAFEIWKPFKTYQRFDDPNYYMDQTMQYASVDNPVISSTHSISGIGKYTTGVINYAMPNTYDRYVTIRSVGWVDKNNNNTLDADEPRKVIDVTARYSLKRSQVFDYAYFINNYGWFLGFTPTSMIIQGDIRANGNLDFINGTATVNGSIYACYNSKLNPPSAGLVNAVPEQWSNNYYNTNMTARMRQAYNSSVHGVKGTDSYEQWRDLIYDKDAGIVNNKISGAVVGDSRGTRKFDGTVLDSTPTQEVPMPDLADISYYQSLSNNYVDEKEVFGDGTANPEYGRGAYIEYYDLTKSPPVKKTINATYAGSLALIGTSDYPIKIHGPVTISEDCVIKGVVTGQGTIYTGRNVHVIGSITYKNSPDFRGSNPSSIDNANEKKDFLGLAARGSVILGNCSNFSSSTLYYMTPPFTKGRYDDYGNYIPAYDANQADGKDINNNNIKKYQSRLGNAFINNNFSNINQIDAVMYTNNLCGGRTNTSGSLTINGSIIAKDEAIIPTGTVRMIYDNRLKERKLTQKPLIDIELPRSPNLMRMAWQLRSSNGY